MFVADWMTRDPQTAREDTRLSEVLRVLHEHRFHQLPVVDGNGRLVGIVTDRDVRSAVGFEARLGDELTVGEVMTASPTTIAADATLDDALTLLCRDAFNAMPVMEGRKLVGIITRHDLIRAFHRVLGLDQPGERVEIALPNLIPDAAAAFSAMDGFDGKVLSAVVSPMRQDGDEPSLYLRVSGRGGRHVEQRLRKAGLIVLLPEHE